MKDNKLIAEFMGVQYKSDEDYFKELAEMREDGIFYEQGYIEVFECNINGGNICICENGNTKLEATYKAVVEFIKQHNKES